VIRGRQRRRDDPELVEAAVALGHQGVALGHTAPHAPARVPWIESLDGVLDWLPPASIGGPPPGRA